VDDEGINTGDSNEEFLMHTIQNPEKDDWFKHIVDKYEGTGKLKDEVVQKFYNVLEKEHLSHNDVEGLEDSIRTSPRRWEQILTYISAALPVKDQADGEALIKNVRLQFQHFLTGQYSSLVTPVVNAVQELIEESSGHRVSGSGTEDTNWRDTLDHQIKMKMKLGSSRKNIPVLAGPPGVGKTSKLTQVARDNRMVLVYVPCANLSTEAVVGTPIPSKGTDEHGNKDISFTKPMLLEQIEGQVKKETKALMASMTAEEKDQFTKQPYNILICFDELNRMKDVNAFNALRRVILENSFSDEWELPKKSMIIAALNQHGTSIVNLTSHMRDVVDAIPVKPDWKATKGFLDNMPVKDGDDADIQETVISAVEQILDHFKDNSKALNEKQFYPTLATGIDLYISPREITNLVENAVSQMSMTIDMMQDEIEEASDESMAKVKDELYNDLLMKVDAVFEGVFNHAGAMSSYPAVKDSLHAWIKHNVVLSETLFHRQAAGAGFASVFGQYWDKPNNASRVMEDPAVGDYLSTVEPAILREELTNFLWSKFDAIKSLDELNDIFGWKEEMDNGIGGKETMGNGNYEATIVDASGNHRQFKGDNFSHDPAHVPSRVGRLVKFCQTLITAAHSHNINASVSQTVFDTISDIIRSKEFSPKSTPEGRMGKMIERLKPTLTQEQWGVNKETGAPARINRAKPSLRIHDVQSEFSMTMGTYQSNIGNDSKHHGELHD